MDIKVNFSGRSLNYTEEEIAAVVEVMRNADPLTQGRYQDACQEKFRTFNGAQHAFACMNGTAALQMAADLCLLNAGDEVVIPSHTFTSSAYPFAARGAKLVFADIDPKTRVTAAEYIEPLLTPRSKVIIVPHLYGFVADMQPILALARKRGLLVVEDACQAIGAEIDGKKAGNFADIGIFSFHSHKNLTTLGEGGMITVKDESRAKIIPMLRHNGHCAYEEKREDYWRPAMGDLDFPELEGRRIWPANYCLGEAECALGIKMLDRVLEINAQKRARAMQFIDALSAYPELEFHRENSLRHNYHLLAARLDGPASLRDAFIRRMFNEFAIKCVVQYYPLNRYPFYQKLGFGQADCPNADNFFDHMVSFPFQHSLTDSECAYMLDCCKKTLDGLRADGKR
ncbi:MAG: DegT/DnrJ/EryC1/StrS family aminotransferase [Desulfovibrio sp.]|jgi:dTDP-4-amino-4,6-dideoxygalactose transaminase|nr:DegT/DnrJ/EryC1/StrS family aminotransferase [Desulfovibrio sp.]